MASFDEHVAQAEHNEEVADILLNPECFSAPWVTITSFYSAIQFIEAAFSKTVIGHLDSYYDEVKNEIRKNNPSQRIPSKHAIMQELIDNDPRFKCFSDEYSDLRTGADAFRYLRKGYKIYFNDKYARKCFDTNLKKIKHELKKCKLI